MCVLVVAPTLQMGLKRGAAARISARRHKLRTRITSTTCAATRVCMASKTRSKIDTNEPLHVGILHRVQIW